MCVLWYFKEIAIQIHAFALQQKSITLLASQAQTWGGGGEVVGDGPLFCMLMKSVA